MNASMVQLLAGIPTPTGEGVFNVRRLPEWTSHYLGRDNCGRATVLIAASGRARTIPLRLAGIEARFSTSCQVAEPGQKPRAETLTAIICISRDAGIEAYFVSLVEAVLHFLGDRPTASAVTEIVHKIVELFQKLRTPAKRSLIGFAGELVAIDASEEFGDRGAGLENGSRREG